MIKEVEPKNFYRIVFENKNSILDWLTQISSYESIHYIAPKF